MPTRPMTAPIRRSTCVEPSTSGFEVSCRRFPSSRTKGGDPGPYDGAVLVRSNISHTALFLLVAAPPAAAPDPYQERMTALFRVSERRRRKYKQMVEDAHRDAASTTSGSSTASATNSSNNPMGTAIPNSSAGVGRVRHNDNKATLDLTSSQPTTTMNTAPKLSAAAARAPTTTEDGRSRHEGEGEVTPGGGGRRALRWSRNSVRSARTSIKSGKAVEAATTIIANSPPRSTGTTAANNSNTSTTKATVKRATGITWDDKWFLRNSNGTGTAGRAGDIDKQITTKAEVPTPLVLQSSRTASIVPGQPEPRVHEYDRDEPEPHVDDITDVEFQSPSLGWTTTTKAAGGRKDDETDFADNIGALMCRGSWIDVESAASPASESVTGRANGRHVDPSTPEEDGDMASTGGRVLGDSDGVLVETHSRTRANEEQIEVYYDDKATARGAGTVVDPDSLVASALLMRQLDHITGELVEIQIGGTEGRSPARCATSNAGQRSPTSVRDPLTGNWVELEAATPKELMAKSPSSTSSSSSSSMTGERALNESWSTVHEEDSRTEVDDDDDEDDDRNLSGYTNDTMVEELELTSPGGVVACGFGEGFCVTASAPEDLDIAAAAATISGDDDAISPHVVKRDPSGVTVAEFLAHGSSDASHPKVKHDESTCGSHDDEASASSSEDEEEEDDSFDDDIVDDNGTGEPNDQLLSRPSYNEGIMAQYLCCGQDQAMLMEEDSFDVDDDFDEYGEDSATASR